MKKYLLIGNGIAGTTAAEQIRKHDPDGQITLLTKESLPLYSRIRLPDYLCGKIDETGLVVKNQEWHDKNNIRLMTGTEIKRLDCQGKKVFSSNGDIFEFDELLLATGSNSFVPPIKGKDQTNVMTLRNLDDAKALVEINSNIKNMVIIGGGVLGLEAAAALIQDAIKITVVEYCDRLLPRQLDYEGAKHLQILLEKMGFIFRLGEETEEIIGKDSAKDSA
ncbi:MAG: FAD-dependent oxidoreductase [Desulfamplus sp.]|nr:FAD-dependent oxidoreductase [Desulfamplus sp.]